MAFLNGTRLIINQAAPELFEVPPVYLARLYRCFKNGQKNSRSSFIQEMFYET